MKHGQVILDANPCLIRVPSAARFCTGVLDACTRGWAFQQLRETVPFALNVGRASRS